MTKNSCSWYAVGMAKINFPEGKVCCDLCPLLETYARKQCRMTGEYLAVDTRVTTGYGCPLDFELSEGNNGTESEYAPL